MIAVRRGAKEDDPMFVGMAGGNRIPTIEVVARKGVAVDTEGTTACMMVVGEMMVTAGKQSDLERWVHVCRNAASASTRTRPRPLKFHLCR